MTFTQEDEEILKLMAAEMKASMKLLIERDDLIPLQEASKSATAALKERCR